MSIMRRSICIPIMPGAGYKPGLCPVAEPPRSQILTLPMFPGHDEAAMSAGWWTRSPERRRKHPLVVQRQRRPVQLGQRAAPPPRGFRPVPSAGSRPPAESDFRPRQHKAQRRRQWRDARLPQAFREHRSRCGAARAVFPAALHQSSPAGTASGHGLPRPAPASRVKVPSASRRWSSRLKGSCITSGLKRAASAAGSSAT